MKKSRGIAGLLGTILMIALLAYTVSFDGADPTVGYEKISKLGLDLAAGSVSPIRRRRRTRRMKI